MNKMTGHFITPRCLFRKRCRISWRVKRPADPAVVGLLAGLGSVVRAETVAPGRLMLDDSPGGEAVTVPVTVVV